ncbi:ATP-grasp domain-containing protein [Propionivibrio sp.]|uniref:ATP-grasp domain-containing protein n=1 Tax=Propionivibrio sp. TaxID=2212460 RepID=UPI003BEFD143
MTFASPDPASQFETPFIGLAPFLRVSIAGTDLLPIGQEMLAVAGARPDDANLWMNLSLAMQCVGQRDLGLAIQAQALELKRIYHLAAAEQPARLRLLMLMVPGDLSANTPLECLLEASDIDLDFYYVYPDSGNAPNSTNSPLALPVPEHDVLIVAMSECDENREILGALEHALAVWPKPVINAAQHIPSTGRELASALLQDAPGLLIPPTLRASRAVLLDIASGVARLPELFDGCDFPVILRPVGSHAGRDLNKIDDPAAIANYLSRVDEEEFFMSRFIDYSGKDGLFRKMRVALIDGAAFACHMGVSSNWMIHYVNAGMYEEAWKRDEEANFMAHFDDFAQRHRLALEAIYQRTKLDYLCIDCAETPDGQLLVFEIDHAMVVHAMDPEHQFPYKQPHMLKVKNAFRDYLFRLTAAK